MILAVDVDYKDNKLSISGLTFQTWQNSKETESYDSLFPEANDYISGQFFQRELPCILTLLKEHKLSPSYIVIDGYVFLDGIAQKGLGKYLYDSLGGKVKIIGVAKNKFRNIPNICEVYRGSSKKPLYVTSEGIDLDVAKRYIQSMHGKFRILTLLKKVDQICRGITPD